MILMTADWHIKIGQKNVPRDWAINRYHLFFKKIKEAEKGCNLHIVSGDIFDKLPNMEELEIYFEFVRNASIKTFILSGNHEATKKGHTFLSNLKTVTNAVNPLVSIIDEIYEEDSFSIVPYEFIHKKGVWDSIDKSKAVFSHIRGEIPPHVKPEIDLELLKDFPVVYLGDLHSHDNCQRNLVYPGSPMVTSFHRNRVNTGYLHIDSTDLSQWEWKAFDLPQLIRKTVTDPAEMVATYPDHTIYEIEGSVVDLSNVKNNDLLDKKLVKRATDATLILDKDMSIEDELVEYFRYVLEIDDAQIKEALTTYNDYIKDTEMG